MTEAEIKKGLLSIDGSHEFYKALMEVLEGEVRSEQVNATLPDLADGARHFNAGRLAQAMDARNVIEGLRADALRERDEADKKARLNAEREARSVE